MAPSRSSRHQIVPLKWLRCATQGLCYRRSRSSSVFLILAGSLLWTGFLCFDIFSSPGDGSLLTFDPSHRLDLRSMLETNATDIPKSDDNISAQRPLSSSKQSNSQQQQPVVRASELPDASMWQPTDGTPYEVCFVTSIYATSPEVADRPPDIRDIQMENPTFRFFAFTNLPDIDAPGWTIKVQTFNEYRRYITQSRWAKFMGWKDSSVHSCQAVFYMDGFCGPKTKHSERYKRLAKAIAESEFGLFQNEHDVAVGPLDELDRILLKHKDIAKNVEASKAWLQSQPDFREDARIYANHYIGYNPKSPHFQQAAEFFWKRYSLEQDSWRDQPLWSYALDHFHIIPTRLGTFDALFKEYYKRMGYGGHRYSETAERNALAPQTEHNR